METQTFRITHPLHASRTKRFLNFIIDTTVIYIIGMIIGLTFVLLSHAANNLDLADRIQNGQPVEYVSFLMIIMIIYYSLMEAYYSRTIGKYFTKTLVVLINGEKPSNRLIFIRTLCRLIPFDPLTYLGTIPRGWHDLISKTFVVPKHDLSEKKLLFEVSQKATKK